MKKLFYLSLTLQTISVFSSDFKFSLSAYSNQKYTLEVFKSCNICKRTFSEVSEAKVHLAQEHIRCAICDCCFESNQTLSTHIKDEHYEYWIHIVFERIKSQKCFYCNEEFKTPFKAQMHILERHLVCPSCGVKAQDLQTTNGIKLEGSNLLKRLNAHFSCDHPEKCLDCGCHYKFRDDFYAHPCELPKQREHERD